MTARLRFGLLVGVVFHLSVPPESSALWQYRSAALSVRLTGYIKTLAVGQQPSLPELPDTATDFTRARVMLEGDVGRWLGWAVHYEHLGVINPSTEPNAGLFSGDRQAGGSSLLPFDWTARHNSGFVWRHALDRAHLRVRLPRADITIGRQALSWGVGRLWTPADLFVAFSPVAIDQEFKPGIDAVRARILLDQFSQLEAVYAAFGANFRHHAIGLRGQTSVRDFDLGLIAGKFFHDLVLGPFFAGEVRGVGIRGELTLTRNSAGRVQEPRTFFRGVSSLDYRSPGGLYGLLEYYYNGFGQTDAGAYPRLFSSRRLTRGEVFNFGRHYLGGLLNYDFHPLVRGSLFGQWNLLDLSGLVGPLLLVSVSDEADLRLGAYFPWGARSRGGRVRSEYGLYPRVYYAQLRLYF